MRRDGQVAPASAEWHWSWSYRGDGRASLLHLFNRATSFAFVGVPPERVDVVAPFAEFDLLFSTPEHSSIDSPVRRAWCAWVVTSSDSAQTDRRAAIPRMIVEQTTGRDATQPEIKAVAKLCNTIDPSHGGKTYAVADVDVRAALDSVAAPAMF